MSAPRGANEAFARVLVDELARSGVRHACVAPGSRSGPFALALAADDRISMHVQLDERSAAFFALGVAKASGTPAVVLTTSGTAAANLLPAIAEARHSVTPMIALTADRPPELRATGANQTIDQIKMFGDAVVWFAEAGTPDVSASAPAYWRSLASRAVSEALGVPAGPVHLNLPLRDPLYPDDTTEPFPHDTGGRVGGSPWTIAARPARVPDPADVDSVAEVLRNVERGLVVAGASSHDLRPLLRVAEALGWPVLAEPASGLRVPGTVSTYDALLRTESFAAAHRPDVVLRVGKLSLGRPLAGLLRTARQLALDPDGFALDEHRTIEFVLTGDIDPVANAVLERIDPRGKTSWSRSWRDADDTARAAVDATIDSFDEASEPRIARDLAASIPAGANLFAASSMPVRDLECFMHPRDDVRVFANRGANGIDGCVSTTLGIAAATGRPTFGLLGDVAVLHDSNGLLADDASATLVVVNNDGGGIFSFLEQADVVGFERVFGTPHGRTLEGLAAFHGWQYERRDTPDPLPSLPASSAGRRIIEVRTGRRANVVHHRRIWDAVAAALQT